MSWWLFLITPLHYNRHQKKMNYNQDSKRVFHKWKILNLHALPSSELYLTGKIVQKVYFYQFTHKYFNFINYVLNIHFLPIKFI